MNCIIGAPIPRKPKFCCLCGKSCRCPHCQITSVVACGCSGVPLDNFCSECGKQIPISGLVNPQDARGPPTNNTGIVTLQVPMAHSAPPISNTGLLVAKQMQFTIRSPPVSLGTFMPQSQTGQYTGTTSKAPHGDARRVMIPKTASSTVTRITPVAAPLSSAPRSGLATKQQR